MFKITDSIIYVELNPYLIYDDTKIRKLGNNKITEYLLDNKLVRMNQIINGTIRKFYDIVRYEFDGKKKMIKAILTVKPKDSKIPNIFDEKRPIIDADEDLEEHIIEKCIEKDIEAKFGTKEQMFGDDSTMWMPTNPALLEKDEYDKKTYYISILPKTIFVKLLK